MLQRKRLAAGGVFLVVASLSALDHAGVFGGRAGERATLDGVEATVVWAADGDTIDVDIRDGTRPSTRVRLRGIDCPEVAHRPGEKDDHFGREAADFVRRRIVGQRVRLELDPHRPHRDRYGRLLAYVFLLRSGEMLNEELIRLGLAYADRRFPHVFHQRFVQVEKRVMKLKVGLWEGAKPGMMPAWRQRMDAGLASAIPARDSP
jgi:micrococcal nuclease